MVHPDKRIESLTQQAANSELVSQLTPDRKTRLRNEERAADLRNRIDNLRQRLAKLKHDYPEK